MDQLIYILLSALCFIPALVLHEVAHGLAAFALGDPTARNSNRLSLNPIKHIDPFGTVLLPALMMLMGGPVFGYAKPVPYNPRYFKNPRLGDVLVGLAGPAANLVLALVAAILMLFLSPSHLPSAIDNGLYVLFYAQYLPLFILTNLYLMFFNLLPVPPLDGSSVLALIWPKRKLGTYYQIQRYALPIFMIVVFGLPYFLHIDLVGAYLRFTAGGLGNFLFSLAGF